MNESDFNKWFNKAFWKAFKNKAFPIEIPQTEKEKSILLKKVYKSILSSQYAPSVPEAEIVINKGHGVARTVPVFCIEDYCVYYFCVKELEDVLCVNRTENTFGGWSLGGELRRKEKNEIECESTEYGRYSFNPNAWTTAFNEFNALLFSQVEGGSYSYVLQLDLANFYESIRLDTLERWIREEADASKGWVITLLFYFLNHWNRRNTGLHPQIVGLPQDALADCSRILANYYLQKYDAYAANVCLNLKSIYFRYSDDQMILLNDRENIEITLLLLTRNLDRYGLRVNQKKVSFWKKKELLEHRCRSIQALFSKKDDNKNPALVKKFVEMYLKIPASELPKKWNQGMPLLNRLLWANLESLPIELFQLVLPRFLLKEFILQADHKKLGRVYDLCKKLGSPVNFIELLKEFGDKTFHNSYHNEAIAFAMKINDSALELSLKERLNKIDETCDLISSKPPLIKITEQPYSDNKLEKELATIN